MAYTTGSATSFAAMLTALTDACVADGWTWDSGNEVIWKGAIFAKLSVVSGTYGGGLSVLGRTSTTAGDGPNYAQIGPALQTALIFPITYHIFTFANEIMMVISSGDQYQWLTFGQSQQPGLPGSGNFYGASLAVSVDIDLWITSSQGYATQALFWNTSLAIFETRNCYIDSDLDGGGWSLTTNPVGIKYATELIDSQPNSYNNESVLIPIKGFLPRASDKFSQTLEVENARHMRIDNYQNEDIITLGLDKWMVFPWFVKNTAVRNGGDDVLHTGTFGWAIRYEGP
jgi:hypothetical protein